MKALNLLRVLANTSWGADQSTLLHVHLYIALIRSKLDHECIVHGSARPPCLEMLDPIHNSAPSVSVLEHSGHHLHLA